jgi:general secretion pathway protein E/type IV pilus assembly protein PilB
MRHFLRHDPDVVLIGELRDEETAKTAITAATTGHLVLSTLHTNTALGAVPRLQGLGVETDMMAESLIGVLAQRLVRTICPHCMESYSPSQAELDYLKVEADKLYRGRSCDACNHTGYLGRTVVYELMVMDKETKRMLEQSGRLSAIEEHQRNRGFKTMFDVGVRKVKEGVTTVAELQRILGRTKY